MRRERRHLADLYARLHYRVAHPVRTLGLVAWLSCLCMLIGASAPAHSGAKGGAHKAGPMPTQVRGVNLSPNRAFWPAPYSEAADGDRGRRSRTSTRR